MTYEEVDAEVVRLIESLPNAGGVLVGRSARGNLLISVLFGKAGEIIPERRELFRDIHAMRLAVDDALTGSRIVAAFGFTYSLDIFMPPLPRMTL